MLLVYSQRCASMAISDFRIFSSSQKEILSPLASLPRSSTPQPWATTDLLSVSVDSPLLNIHARGIIQHGVFYDWLLPLSIMFSRFIHGVVCIGVSFLFLAK